MKTLSYKVHKLSDGYEAVCIEHPHITWIAETKDKAMEGIQEHVFHWLAWDDQNIRDALSRYIQSCLMKT